MAESVIKLKKKIASLEKAIEKEKKLTNKWRERVTISNKNRRYALGKQANKYRLWSRRYYSITQKKINARAKEHYHDSVKIQLLIKSNTISPISAFPILKKWAADNNWSDPQLQLFIILNHFHFFNSSQGEIFGFSSRMVTKYAKQLIKLSLVEDFHGKVKSYVVSVTGRKLFAQFTKYYQTQMELLMRELEKAMVRTGRTDIKIDGEFINKMNLFEKLIE